jgi:type I restriction enzyme S subunit
MISTWKTCDLGEVVNLQRGHDLPSQDRSSGAYPIISSAGFSGYHDEYKAKAPGVVTGRYGTIGEVFYVNTDYWPLNTTLYVKDFTGNVPRFVFYLLQCLNLKEMNAAGAVPGINRNHVHKLKVKLPPLLTQTKIAKILSAYDELIENNLKRIKLLDEIAQNTYEEWFVRFRFPNYENTKLDAQTELPEGWQKRTISDFCSNITDGTHDSPKPKESGYKLITGKHVINGFIEFDTAYYISKEDHLKIKKRSGLEKGDILFSNIGTLGSTAIVTQDFEFSCKNVIIFKYKEGYSYFLYTYLNNKNIQNKLSSQSAGVAQKFYGLNFIRLFQDIFPPNDLIELFDRYVSAIYKLKYKLYESNNKLKEARDILLPRLMTGVIDVDTLMKDAA